MQSDCNRLVGLEGVAHPAAEDLSEARKELSTPPSQPSRPTQHDGSVQSQSTRAAETQPGLWSTPVGQDKSPPRASTPAKLVRNCAVRPDALSQQPFEVRDALRLPSRSGRGTAPIKRPSTSPSPTPNKPPWRSGRTPDGGPRGTCDTPAAPSSPLQTPGAHRATKGLDSVAVSPAEPDSFMGQRQRAQQRLEDQHACSAPTLQLSREHTVCQHRESAAPASNEPPPLVDISAFAQQLSASLGELQLSLSGTSVKPPTLTHTSTKSMMQPPSAAPIAAVTDAQPFVSIGWPRPSR